MGNPMGVFSEMCDVIFGNGDFIIGFTCTMHAWAKSKILNIENFAGKVVYMANRMVMVSMTSWVPG